MFRTIRRALVAAVAAAAAFGCVAGTAHARDVMLIGNAESGTVSFIDSQTFQNLGSLNVTPDFNFRVSRMNLVERIGYETVTSVLGGKRVLDDLAVSPDGRTLYASRSSLADFTAWDIATGQQKWRHKIDGFRSDHLAVSPDGKRIVVSATTANKAIIIDAATGKRLGTFPTGTYAHGNDWSKDGKTIWNASIGVTSLPYALKDLKGERQLTAVDGDTYRVKRVYSFDRGVRPAVLSPDETKYYTQLSYFRGFIEYDLVQGKELRRVALPANPLTAGLPFDSFPQNSAHHGMALSGDGTRICAAGTIDNYAAIVTRADLQLQSMVPTGNQPYWSETNQDGTKCFLSNSKDGTVSVVDFASGAEVARVAVGRYPQRERRGTVPDSILARLSPSAG